MRTLRILPDYSRPSLRGYIWAVMEGERVISLHYNYPGWLLR